MVSSLRFLRNLSRHVEPLCAVKRLTSNLHIQEIRDQLVERRMRHASHQHLYGSIRDDRGVGAEGDPAEGEMISIAAPARGLPSVLWPRTPKAKSYHLCCLASAALD